MQPERLEVDGVAKGHEARAMRADGLQEGGSNAVAVLDMDESNP